MAADDLGGKADVEAADGGDGVADTVVAAAAAPSATRRASVPGSQRLSDHEGEEEDDGDTPAVADGEPPFDPPFAQLLPPFGFWVDAVALLLLGGALGAFAWCYLKAITEVNNLWLRADGKASYPEPDTLGFGQGRAWWIGLCGGAGLAVGCTRVVLGVETVPSFVAELRTMHVEPLPALKSSLVSLLGLLGGVPMGPEAGLGSIAGAAGTLLARLGARLAPRRSGSAPLRRRLAVLAAMSSVFAAILPTPLTALLLVLELSRAQVTLGTRYGLAYGKLITFLVVAATGGFVVYYAIAGYTYLNPLFTTLSALLAEVYEQMYVVAGLLFGVMGAALATVYILLAGVARALVGAMRRAMEALLGRKACVVVLATLGGAATGALGWAMPLVLTDGAEQLATILAQPQAIGSSVLAASAFAKAFAYHLSAECGFVGGLFLPMLATSSMLGAVFRNVTSVNPLVAASCAMIALPAALVDAPLMLAVLAVSMLQIGPQGLVPILTTAVTAHVLCLGIGLPQWLVAKAKGRAGAAAA